MRRFDAFFMESVYTISTKLNCIVNNLRSTIVKHIIIKICVVFKCLAK